MNYTAHCMVMEEISRASNNYFTFKLFILYI